MNLSITTSRASRFASSSCGQSRRLPGRRNVVVKADDSDTDWDLAWRSFQKQVRSQVDTQPMTAKQPPIRPLRPQQMQNQQDKIRVQERVLLDLWSQEDFLKVGGVAAALLLLAVLASAGPMPLDDRCTLPWC